MITIEAYFTNPTTGEVKPHGLDHEDNARELLKREAALYQEFLDATGHARDIDPDTGTEISGKKNGSGDGGFRVKGSPTSQGRLSSHEEGSGVDRSDQDNAFDAWLSSFDEDDGHKNAMLEKHQLYREHPDATPTWCHTTTRAPVSRRRTFRP